MPWVEEIVQGTGNWPVTIVLGFVCCLVVLSVGATRSHTGGNPAYDSITSYYGDCNWYRLAAIR